ncbi:MAG TPA: hypothetical protein VMH30_14170, partial [Verrucomicrobiae bacterium]|nr:hypothetical protein [Verrucomicrobiae bacterium]
MKFNALRLTVLCLCLLSFRAAATTYYVDINNTNATPPYTNWSTAATDIQSAVNQTTNGDSVLVNPGVYQSGGYTAPDGSLTAVVVTNAVTIQGVDGLAQTSINGSNTMRCLYLGNGASLMGFTLTNGAAGNGGGVFCPSTTALLANCLLISNSASSGGGAYSGTISNCTLTENICPPTGGNGGGAANSVLYNCTVSGNVTGGNTGATSGGGANNCKLTGCTVSGNASHGAGAAGGGAYTSTLNNCTVSGNSADDLAGGTYNCNCTNSSLLNNTALEGGGASGGTLVNCTISGNNAYSDGGGVYYGATIYNSTLSGNVAQEGGGADDCTLINCLLTGNTASSSYDAGAGANYGTLINCTVVNNTAVYYEIVNNQIVGYAA